MNIYEALQSDHRAIETLLDRMVLASETDDETRAVFLDSLSKILIPHAHAEEEVFYNALREIPELKATILHSYAEHGVADMELRGLKGAESLHTNWPSLARKLRADLRHHIEEEEGKLFAEARKYLSDDDADQLGTAFIRLKPIYADDSDSMLSSTFDLVANLMPARFAKILRKAPRPQPPSTL